MAPQGVYLQSKGVDMMDGNNHGFILEILRVGKVLIALFYFFGLKTILVCPRIARIDKKFKKQYILK
jgi:hypothetical protein